VLLRLPRYLASSAFGIGMAIGLLLNIGLFQGILMGATATREVAARSDGTICDQLPPDLSLEQQAFVSTQCEVHQALFADGTAPSAAFAFDAAMSTPGVYVGRDHLNRPVKFEAAWCMPIDLKVHSPALWQQGVEVYPTVGTLSGPAGKIAVAAVELFTAGLTPDTGHVFFVTRVLSPTEMSTFGMAARIATGIRVLDTASGALIPLADLTGNPQVWGFSADLATLYCGCNEGGFGGGVDPQCLKNAYDAFNVCRQSASLTLTVCIVAATAALLVCSAGCTFVGPVAPGCIIVCCAMAVIATAACYANAAIAYNACHNQLKIDLRACGVNLLDA
jgi:hypothetical protein